MAHSLTLRAIRDSALGRFGDIRTFHHVTEDALNYYAHGIPNEPYPGIHSSYLTLPKWAWKQESS